MFGLEHGTNVPIRGNYVVLSKEPHLLPTVMQVTRAQLYSQAVRIHSYFKYFLFKDVQAQT